MLENIKEEFPECVCKDESCTNCILSGIYGSGCKFKDFIDKLISEMKGE